MLGATVSVRVFELTLVAVALAALLLGIAVGWQSRDHYERSRRGGDVDLTGRNA